MAVLTKKAVILVAGRGSRLRPHTDTRPKCLVPFAGWPLLEWQSAALRTAGVDEIELVRGYRGELLDGMGYHVWDNPRWQETNMVQSLLCARDTLSTRRATIISYGDILYEPRVVESLIQTPADIAVVIDKDWLELWRLRHEDPLDDAETLRVDESGRIIEIGCRPSSIEEIQGRYVGLIKLEGDGTKRLLRFLDSASPGAEWLEGRDLARSHMTDVLRGLIRDGMDIKATPVSRGWCEFDTVRDLELYRRLRESGRLRRFIDLPETPDGW